MALLSIILVIIFSSILCIVEIPNMLKDKLYRELIAFSVILFCGIILTILKSLDIQILNPSDIIATVYSPIVTLIKGALE